MKTFHSAVCLQEHLLRGIRRVGGVMQDAVHEAVDGLVVVRDQPRIRLFRTRLQFGDDRGFFRPYSDRASQVAHGRFPRHHSHGVTFKVAGYVPANNMLNRMLATPRGNFAPLHAIDTSDAPEFPSTVTIFRAPAPL
jgi:hypothetical protein